MTNIIGLLLLCAMRATQIDIAGVERPLLFKKLYNRALRLSNSSSFHFRMRRIDTDEARKYVGEYTTELRGVSMHIEVPLEGNTLDAEEYDARHGAGIAEQVVAKIRERSSKRMFSGRIRCFPGIECDRRALLRGCVGVGVGVCVSGVLAAVGCAISAGNATVDTSVAYETDVVATHVSARTDYRADELNALSEAIIDCANGTSAPPADLDCAHFDYSDAMEALKKAIETAVSDSLEAQAAISAFESRLENGLIDTPSETLVATFEEVVTSGTADEMDALLAAFRDALDGSEKVAQTKSVLLAKLISTGADATSAKAAAEGFLDTAVSRNNDFFGKNIPEHLFRDAAEGSTKLSFYAKYALKANYDTIDDGHGPYALLKHFTNTSVDMLRSVGSDPYHFKKEMTGLAYAAEDAIAGSLKVESARAALLGAAIEVADSSSVVRDVDDTFRAAIVSRTELDIAVSDAISESAEVVAARRALEDVLVKDFADSAKAAALVKDMYGTPAKSIASASGEGDFETSAEGKDAMDALAAAAEKYGARSTNAKIAVYDFVETAANAFVRFDEADAARAYLCDAVQNAAARSPSIAAARDALTNSDVGPASSTQH